MSTKRAKAGANGRKKPPVAQMDVPVPFRQAPDSLQPFFEALSPKHVYVAHVDSRPRAFKRKIFAIPVLMNIAVALLFVWRMWYIAPYYYLLLETTFGSANEMTLVASSLSWREIALVTMRRGFNFMLDFCLAIFVWPWPIEFCTGGWHASPVQWRWMVGFRDKEIYVRRSREWYAEALALGKAAVPASGNSGSGVIRDDPGPAHAKVDVTKDPKASRAVLAHIMQATSSLLLQQKTGYLTMNGDWDLDWALMIWATRLIDDKDVALEAFSTVAFVHHDLYGWLTVDLRALHGETSADAPAARPSPGEEQRRLQVFAFREALAALDKEDLFFRWIEIIQFEASKPGGLGNEEQQAAIAQQVRTLFKENNVDFDAVWREAVGTESLAGM